MWCDLRNQVTGRKKHFHFTKQWASWHVSVSICENCNQKYLKLTSLKLTFLEIFKNKSLFFSIFSKFCLKKFPFYWHRVLLNVLLCWSLENVFKNTQNLPPYNILKLTFLGIFKNENFNFSRFSRKFCHWRRWNQKNTLKNIMYLLSPVITTGWESSGAIFHDKFFLPNSGQQCYTASLGEWSNLSFSI